MMVSNYLIHIAKSFGVHIFFGVVVVLSFNFTAPMKEQKEPDVNPIEAVVIDAAALEQQVQSIQKKKDAAKAAEEKRVKDLERRADNAQKKLNKLERQTSSSERAAKEAKRKAEAEKQKAAAEKKKADKAKKERIKREREAEKAKQQAAEAKKKKEAEQKALKAAEEKRKADAEKARKEKERKDREAKERALQEKLMQEQLAREQQARSKARRKHVLKEKDKYSALIMAKIKQNLLTDETMKNKSCRLNIKIAFSGLVTKVSVLSGDTFLCKAAERAVLKAETLPVSKEPDVFEELKSIILRVEPEL